MAALGLFCDGLVTVGSWARAVGPVAKFLAETVNIFM
ncbi:hypothetical protein PAN31117_01347 [Pandoraea anapnoica]|uniref:Uncharacterized protein n=1 Tax=Pandoraea anapnoica TaxID=2508301 RepID=A0A5E4ZS88_9BURK|nr:hypothetical protein PAN31117_01347 [Pandoraea anapnoica]